MYRLVVGAAVFGTCIACSHFDPEVEGPARGDDRLDVGGQVELFSWWTSGGEREAFDALLGAHKKRVHDADVTNAAVLFAEKAREQLALRFSYGVPPDTFQANTGADLMGWVLAGGSGDEESFVERLDDLAAALDWHDSIDQDLLASVTFENHVYGVPVNVHRINSIFYRKDIFEELGLDVPTTLDGLLEFCERIHSDEAVQLRSPSGRMSCLALGNQWNWTISLLTLEMIYPAIAGAEAYAEYFTGQRTAVPADLRQALQTALTLYCGGKIGSGCLKRTWFNPDINETTWDQGVHKLTEETALLAPMGDWAKGYLESEEGGSLVPGQDFDVAPFPGTDDIFVFGADAFTLPKGAPNRDGARSFLKTVGSVDGQIAFNRLKGSIPARTDIDPEQFDVVTRETMRAFREATKVRALSGYLSGAAREALHPELSDSIKSETVEIIERHLQVNYPFD